LDYLLRPAVAAAIVTATRTATAALLLPEPVRASPTLYPPPEILRRGECSSRCPPPPKGCGTVSGPRSSPPDDGAHMAVEKTRSRKEKRNSEGQSN
jgi:hypothetical protein